MTDLRTALELKARMMGLAQGRDLAPMSWETLGQPQAMMFREQQFGPDPSMAPSGPFQYSRPSLIDMLVQTQTPTTLLDAMGGSQFHAPIPAPLPSFRKKVPPVPAMPSAELQAKRREAPKAHTVKRGDTMSAIAKANGMTLAELKRRNPQIKNANRIYVGDKINL